MYNDKERAESLGHFNIITDLSDYYIVEGTDISVIPANTGIQII